MTKQKNSSTLEFEDAIGDNDFGLIICSKTGRLKGLWIPDGQDEDRVPETIVNICVDYFGIDPNTHEETMH